MCTPNVPPVCIAKGIQCVLAGIQPRRYHGNLKRREQEREREREEGEVRREERKGRERR